ncbi:hypothetical protein [Desulfococcus sp.]|uniref:hypothetical protein n=1 Tax=Desulfococcus sp. TaxID=2025834 RepID=UPI0035941221
MKNNAIKCDDTLIGALTQIILNDALNTVLGEFERNTETSIGRVVIESKDEGRDNRVIRIEVRSTGDKCLEGLARYKKALCQDKQFKNEPFCHAVEF